MRPSRRQTALLPAVLVLVLAGCSASTPATPSIASAPAASVGASASAAAGPAASSDGVLAYLAAEFEASPVSNAGSALAVSERDQIRFLLERMEAEDALGPDIADRVVAAFDELRARQASAEATRRDAQASRLTLATRRAVDPAAEVRMGSDWSLGFSSGVVDLAGRLLTGEPGGSTSDSFETSWDANGTKANLKASFSLTATGGGGTARVTGKATVTVTLVAPDGSVTSLVAVVNAEGTLGACPDEDGVVRGELTFTGTAELTGKTPASATLTIHAVARGIVGDDAFLQSAELRQDGEIEAVVPVLGVSGSSALSGSYEFPAGPGGTIDVKQVMTGFQAGYKVSFEETSYAMSAELAGHVMAYPAFLMSFLALEAIADASQKAWRGGTCLEIRTQDTGGERVPPAAQVVFMATLWHRIEGREVQKPITVSLDGPASVTPSGTPEDPPVLVTYIAGDEPGEQGVIALRSVSRRGIAEKSIAITVRSGWAMKAETPGMVITASHCGSLEGEWVQTTTYRNGISGKDIWTFELDEETMTGTWVENFKTVLGGEVTCTGHAVGTFIATLRPDGSVFFNARQPKDAYASCTGARRPAIRPANSEIEFLWKPDDSFCR